MYSILLSILSFSISTTFAAGTGPGSTIPVTTNPAITSVSFTGPFGSDTIETVLARLITYAQVIGASVAAIMILWGAFQILTSHGVPAQITAGKKTIIYALGGLVVIILASGLVSLFAALTRSLGI